MWEFILFLRDFFVSFTAVIDTVVFDIAGMNITLFEMLLGVIGMGFVVSVFWKGARS